MSAPDELRTAAERLEERAARRERDIDFLVMPDAKRRFMREAAERRAMAALLKTVRERTTPFQSDCGCDRCAIFAAALAVARVVAGDPT